MQTSHLSLCEAAHAAGHKALVKVDFKWWTELEINGSIQISPFYPS